MKDKITRPEARTSDHRLENLQVALNYRFNDLALLQTALTHRSYNRASNERLEFLGDAILNATISHYLFTHYVNIGEGRLSYIRSSLVNKQSLLDLAVTLNLADHMLCATTLHRTHTEQDPPSLLADAFEAIIGAIYLDGGAEKCTEVVLALYATKLRNIDLEASYKDVKTHLQELMQSRHGKVPVYELVTTAGMPHTRHFVVACILPDQTRYTGEGSSMKRAEKAAAAKALAALME